MIAARKPMREGYRESGRDERAELSIVWKRQTTGRSAEAAD